MTMNADNPFAFWTVFHGIHHWFFARGCPPTIAPLRGWRRVLPLSVLLVSLGLTATMCGLTAVWCVGLSQAQWGAAVLGAGFGGLLLLPISRWVGRPWWLALLTVPLCAVWFWTFGHWWLFYQGVFSDVRGKAHDVLVWWAAMTTMGLGPALWMSSPLRWRSWLAPPVVAAGTAIAAAAYGYSTRWMPSLTWPMPAALGRLLDFIVLMQPVALFLTVTSAALGIRLWWPTPDEIATHASPRPAANTAETSTAKPGSSTDVAESPDLNSP
jgi:hypothetical protein